MTVLDTSATIRKVLYYPKLLISIIQVVEHPTSQWSCASWASSYMIKLNLRATAIAY
jgi:hypothetical protein